MTKAELALEFAKTAQGFFHDYRLVFVAWLIGKHQNQPEWVKKLPSVKNLLTRKKA